MADSYEKTMLKLEKMAQNTNAQQMNWQEKMSNTSHQREVKDLIAAGINPVLSANQGAQSYTTSLDSAASAVGNLASAKQGADATKFAARQSAAATRAAAAANLKAAQAAASAQRYAADQHYAATKYQTDHSKTGTVAGVLSEIFNRGIADGKQKGIFSSILKAVDKVRSNPVDVKKFLHDPNKAFSWKNMNWRGIKLVNQQMDRFGVKRTKQTQSVFIDAFYNHDKNAMKQWTALVRASNRNRSSANAYRKLYYY